MTIWRLMRATVISGILMVIVMVPSLADTTAHDASSASMDESGWRHAW
ncbi:MAG: hypothetical protein R3A46_02615 [Thermomicrobiales bacterium]